MTVYDVKDFLNYYPKYDISEEGEAVRGSTQIAFDFVKNLIESKLNFIKKNLTQGGYSYPEDDINIKLLIYSEVAMSLLPYYNDPEGAWLKYIKEQNAMYSAKFKESITDMTASNPLPDVITIKDYNIRA